MRSSRSPYLAPRPLPEAPSDAAGALLLWLALAAVAAGWLAMQLGPPPFPDQWPTWTALQAVALLQPAPSLPAPADLPRVAAWSAVLLVAGVLAARLLLIAAFADSEALTVGGVLRAAARRALGALVLLFLIRLPEWPVAAPTPQQLIDAARGGPLPVDGLIAVGVLIAWLAWLWWTTTIVLRGLALAWAALPRRQPIADDGLDLLGLLWLLLGLAGAAWLLLALTGAPHVPRLPTELPSLGALLVLLRSPAPPVDGAIEVLSAFCWLAWAYLAGTLGLHLVAVTALLVTRGATWARALGALSDRVSPRLVRRAVGVAFVVQLVIRPTAAGAAPMTEPANAEVRSAQDPSVDGVVGPTGWLDWPGAPIAADAADRAGVALYTTRTGDTFWSMAEQHFGHGDDYPLIKEANRGRRMPDGSVYDGISDTIYKDWVFAIPEPSRAVEVSGDERIYTTVPGDTLEGIAARLLGGYERWRDLWALNAGARTADGRVLEHPDQLPTGLRLRMPPDTPVEQSPGAAAHDEQPASTDQDQVAAQETADVLYTVQPDDTVWAIAEQFYDVADAAAIRAAVERIAAANLGRRQPGGGIFDNPDQVDPGWTLHLPSPTRGIEIDADGVWYVVRDGETLSSISARLLGHPQRWPELFARNRGQARTPDGRVLEDPDRIWKGLRLLLIPATPQPPAPESPSPPAAEAPAAQTAQPATAEVSTPPSPAAPPRTPSPEPPAPTPAAEPAAWTVSTPEPQVPEAPVRAEPGEPSPLDWDPLPIAAGAAGIGLAAVLFGMRYSRRPPRVQTEVVEPDASGTPVRPATLLADGDDDPNDIRFAERLAGALLRRASRAGLGDVRVLSATVGSSAPVVVLAVPRAGHAALEAVLRSATDLARRTDVNASFDSELIVRLEGVHPEALERIATRARPLLLCVGLLPDRRAWLVGWEALGHLLVASEPGSSHAGEHLAALVASLAARRPPDRLRLYTLAATADPLGQLAPLPHQSALVAAGDAAACARVLASLRAEVDRRLAARLGGRPDGVPALWSELVLVLAELGSVSDSDDLAYLLAHGPQAGLRVLAATADRVTGLGPLVANFHARFVFGLDDEELSMALVGTPAALTLCGPARLLARLGDRPAIEVSGARLEDGARHELLEALDGFGRTSADAGPPPTAAPGPRLSPQTEPGPAAEPVERDGNPKVVSAQPPSPAQQATDLTHPDSNGTVGSVIDVEMVPGASHQNGTNHHNGTSSSGEPVVQVEPPAVAEDDQPPPAVALLASRAQIVVTCADAGVWHAGQRLTIPEGRARELLLRLAAAPALADPVANHRTRIVAELRQERDGVRRDEDNAALAWLNVTGKRLGALLAETLTLDGAAREGWNKLLVVDRQTGVVSLRSELVLSDVQAFVTAAARAVDATLERAERFAAAEEMLALGLPLLGDVGPRVLPDNLPEQVQERLGSVVPTYGWARQDAWERDAPAYLLALWNEAALSVARAYRDSGRYTAAMEVYATLLDRDPQLDNAQQGLLLAAAGIGDPAGLEAAWERVRSAWDGDVPDELQDLRERLLREVAAVRRAGR